MKNQDTTKNAGFQNTSSPSELPKGKNYLLSIGIDKYTGLPTLFNAVKDAQEVVEVLLSKYQFEQTLVMELYNEAATKRNIYKKIRELTERVTPKDNVLIYFSGHGEYDKIAKEGYWIPVDAENGEESDYIPNTVIRKKLGNINSHHTFLMADSCFAGSLFARSAGRNVGKRYERDPSRWGLTAGRNEIVSDGKAGDNSPFAESLLYRLRNNTGALNVQELCSHVTEYVLANSTQTPIGEPLQIEGHKNGQFVFYMKKDEVADWKIATTMGTVQAYEFFLGKYPKGQFAVEATAKVKTLRAAKTWARLKEMPDTTIHQLEKKLQVIRNFTKKYPNAEAIQEVELLGENLHYKKEFLSIGDNLFALKRFARKNTPYREAAQKRIGILENEELRQHQEEEKKAEERAIKEAEEERQPQQKMAKKNARQERVAAERKSTSNKIPISKELPTSEPSFFQKNGKYLMLLCLLPFLIWGVTQMFDSSIEKTGKTPEEVISDPDNNTSLNEDPIEIPTEEQIRKADEAAWKTAQSSHKISAYENYQRKYPKGKYFSEAKKQIANVKEAERKRKEAEATTGTFTDKRDEKTYKWVKLKDGKKWMTENLNYDYEDSYCYNNSESNCRKYGRLYTWKSALKACPSGWHLPTDNEWEVMLKAYGGYSEWGKSNKVGANPKQSYKFLIKGGDTKFAARLGGSRNNSSKFNNLGENGNYWSASGAWDYYFSKADGEVSRYEIGKTYALSCRCVKD